jgi:hypothetical protein
LKVSKFKILILFFVSVILTKAQTKNAHLVGGGLGYSFYSPKINYIGDLNISYIYARKYFMFKYENLFAPSTNFGLINNTIFQFGVTTLIKRKLSINLLLGLIGGGSGSKASNNYDNLETKPLKLYTSGPFLNLGLLYNHKRNNKFYAHFKLQFLSNGFYDSIKYQNKYNQNVWNLSLSLHYRFGKQTPTPPDTVLINKFKKCVRNFKSNVNTILGVDVGYAYDNSIFGAKLDANFNYLFVYKHFIFKTQIGITPFTNFGNVSKVFTTLGFTTKINKMLSWNIMFGPGITFASKPYPIPNKIISGYRSEDLSFHGSLNGVLSSGFYSTCFKNKNILMGLTSSIKGDNVTYNVYKGGGNNLFFTLRTNISINYKF